MMPRGKFVPTNCLRPSEYHLKIKNESELVNLNIISAKSKQYWFKIEPVMAIQPIRFLYIRIFNYHGKSNICVKLDVRLMQCVSYMCGQFTASELFCLCNCCEKR